MKKHLHTLAIITCAFIFLQCNQVNNNKTKTENQETTDVNKLDKSEKQDGILESQKMEFEMTKDVSLGYVPKDRLVAAYTDYIEEQKLGINNKISALTWTERGSNTDIIAPGNVNTRGNQAAADAVTSGRMRAIWTDIADGTVWVGSVSGGLWRSSDITSTSAASWTLVNDFLGNLAISDICQDPTNTNIMYFGTGEKTVNADAVRGGGIWRSTDHGATWNLMPGTNTYYNVSKIACDPAGNLYVATIAGASLAGVGGTGGVFRYNKIPATWDNISPVGLSARITEMRLSTTGRLHVVCGYRTTTPATTGLRYTDNPATVTSGTWTSPATPIPNTLTSYNVELAVAGNTLYAECSNSIYLVGGIYKSIDGGVIWAAVTTPPNSELEPSIMTGRQAWYDLAIGCDPNNPDIVIAGGLNFYRSTDGGITWSQNTRWVGTATNYVHADHHAVVWNTNNTGSGTRVLLATDGGIFYSNNNGVSFTDRNDGLRMKQFYACALHPTTTNYFLAGAQDNGTHQYNNPGLSSSIEVFGGDGAFTHIDQDEPQYQFGAYVFNRYRRSVNGGSSWSQIDINDNGEFINPTDYDDAGNRLYGSYLAGQYIRWNNAQTGTSFSAVSVPLFNASSVLSVTVSQHTPNRVFFGTAGGRIVRVDNAHGAAPAATNITGAGMSASTVSCIATGTNDDNLIATFSNYGSQHIWASANGGTAWTNISGNIPDIPVRWAMFYPEDNTKAIVATEMGVYETDLINGASTDWVRNTSFPFVKTTMLQYRKGDGTLIASTYGRGMWSSNIPFTNPYVRFALNYNTQQEATVATTATCRNYRDYTINMMIDQAPTGTATVTLNLAGGATATQGIDYDYTTNGSFTTPSSVLTFASGSTTPQPITVRIYNDAEVELDEQFTLNYTISGATNALAAPSSGSYTFNLENNDIAPASGTNAVATVLNTARTEYIPNNGTYNFYNGTSIISSITTASANLGCVTSNVFEAGNTWQAFQSGFRSQKVIDITPTTNSGATYTVSLYFTLAELDGQNPALLKIAKTTAATMAGANATNTISAPLIAPTPFGTGYLYTATFSGFSKFFLINAGVALPVTLVSFSGSLNTQNNAQLQWKVSNEISLRNYEIERSYDGVQFTNVGTVNVSSGGGLVKDYGFTDVASAKTVNYYRLKMIDNNGRFRYSDIINIKSNAQTDFVRLLRNPVGSNISLSINNRLKEKISIELYNASGQIVNKWAPGSADGTLQLPFNKPLASGVYMLKFIMGDKKTVLRIVK